MARRGLLAELNHQMQVAAREQERRGKPSDSKLPRSGLSRHERRRSAPLPSSLAPVQPTRSGLPRKLTTHTLPRWRPRSESATSSCLSCMTRSTRYFPRHLQSTTTWTWPHCARVASTRRSTGPTSRPRSRPEPIPDPPSRSSRRPFRLKALKGCLVARSTRRQSPTRAAAHEVAVAQWKSALVEAESARKARARWHADQEAKRVAALEVERARYAKECAHAKRRWRSSNKPSTRSLQTSATARFMPSTSMWRSCYPTRSTQLIFRSSTILSLTPPPLSYG